MEPNSNVIERASVKNEIGLDKSADDAFIQPISRTVSEAKNQHELSKNVTAQDWTGPDDPENPLNWPIWQRVYHTTVPALFGFTVTFGSSVYTPGYPEVIEQFKVSSTVAILPLSLYVLGLAFGPVRTLSTPNRPIA